MQLLLIHSDYFEYKVKKETTIAEKIDESEKHGYLENVLVVFIAVEEKDLEDEDWTINSTIAEIKKVIDSINENKVLLYPYAHLSSELAKASESLKILCKIKSELMKFESLTIKRAPFGWYKSFSIKCKGHPLSELSRHISKKSIVCNINEEYESKESISDALKSESSKKSYWKILDTNGILYDIDQFNLKQYQKLKLFVDYEISKNGTSDWRTELTYSPSSNDAVNGTTVYVRLKKPLSVGNYPGEISVSTVYNVKSSCSTAKQAYTKYVALGGAVTASSIDLSVNLASSEPDTYIYKGSEYKPAISVTNNGSPMASSDYIVSYENNVNAGTATVRITGKPGTIYEGETAETTFTITKRPITITAKANQTKVYGGSDPAEFTYDVSGSLVNGDSFTGSLSRAWGENAGSYAIIQNTLGIVNGNGSDIENYSITFISKDFIITPKTIAVVWQNTTLTYNGNAQKPIAYINGVGDDKRINLSVSGAQTNAGKDYSATASFGAANDNYVLSGETTTFTITKATGIFDNHEPINTDHSQDLILDHLNPELKDGYEWVNPNTPVREGNGHEYDVIYTHPSGNYEPVAGKVTVNATPSADSDTSIDDIIIVGNTADRNGNSFSYLTECGKSTATITVNAAVNATVTINGTQGNTLETPLQYGFNSINISVRAENGNDIQNYTLTVERRIPADIAFVNHFSGVLTVRGQIAGMGAINTAHWYCNGEQIDRDADKRYVEMTQAGSYYALINGSVFTCEVSHLRSTKAFTVSVSPNPVTAGEPLTVSINRTADELRGAQLQLHSTGGQLLQTVPVAGSETTLIAPAYTGTVVVKLVSALGNKEVKVIVK